MTRAPDALVAVRQLLLDHLDIADTARPDDLDPAEVGIVGDPAHRGGYHCGSDRVVTNDYSVVESPRDRSGLTLAAAALDIGWFEIRTGGVTHNLHTFNRWMVVQLEANTPDSRDIREWIYTTDGETVRRWDRLRRRSTGDSSHLWHSHGSFFRDAIKAGRDLTPLFRRYLTEIGLITTPEEPDMPTADEIATRVWSQPYRDYNLPPVDGRPVVRPASQLLMDARTDAARARAEIAALSEIVARESSNPAEVRAALAEVRADMDRHAQAAAVRDAELADLVRQVDAGDLDAAEVVRLIGVRLSAAGA